MNNLQKQAIKDELQKMIDILIEFQFTGTVIHHLDQAIIKINEI